MYTPALWIFLISLGFFVVVVVVVFYFLFFFVCVQFSVCTVACQYERLNSTNMNVMNVRISFNRFLCGCSELLEGDKEYRAMRRQWAEEKRRNATKKFDTPRADEPAVSVRSMLDSKEVILPEPSSTATNTQAVDAATTVE